MNTSKAVLIADNVTAMPSRCKCKIGEAKNPHKVIIAIISP